MNPSNKYVVFAVDDLQIALDLSAVDRVLQAIQFTPLPNAPDIVPGVINVEGMVVPLIDMRKRLGLPERELDLDDQFVIANTSERTVALVVDVSTGVIEPPEKDVTLSEEVLPGAEQFQGVIKLPDGMILIHNLHRFLDLEEIQMLDDALEAATAP